MNLESIQLRGAAGHTRIEHIDGREHLVLPVIALIGNQVIHAVNAAHPERIPTDMLVKAAASFNKKPVVFGHPVKDGKQISANSPEVLAAHGIGTILNTRMDGARLLMDIAVDPVKAEKIGGAKFVADLRASKPCDVSVGAFVACDSVPGEVNGKKFAASWVETQGDHLAVLYPNGRGACSWDAGCGIRAAMHLVTAAGYEEVTEEKKPMKVKSLLDKIGKLVSAAVFDTPMQAATEEAAELIGYMTMRDLMDGVQDSVKSASNIIDELIAAEEETPTATPADEEAETEIECARLESMLAYCNSATSNLMALQTACYKMLSKPVDVPRYMEDGTVERALIGKTISASTMKSIQGMHDAAHAAHDNATSLGAACNGMKLLSADAKALAAKALAAKMEDCPTCDGSGSKDGNPCPSCDGAGEMKAAEQNVNKDGGSTAEGVVTTMTKDERNATIKALAACECSGFKGAAAELEKFEDARLEALQVVSKAGQEAATALKAAQASLKASQESEASLKAAAAAPKPLTVEEFMAVAPAELKTLIESKKAEDATSHAALVAELKTAAAAAYTEDELKALDLPVLRKLAAIAKVNAPADFSGAGLPRQLAQPVDASVPPNPYEAGLKALQASTTKH